MSVVEVEDDGSVRWIWLNRPDRLNAINIELGRELLGAIEEASRNQDVRAVVLAGRGRAFCAGDDLRGEARVPAKIHSQRRLDYLFGDGRWPKVSRALVTMPKPAIAMLQGHAHGAGWDLALSCDFRLAGEDLRVSHAYIRRGLASGLSRLPAYVGIGLATELLMRGVQLDASRARALGLVTEVVPTEKLPDRTKEFATEMASSPTVALALLKEGLAEAYAPGHDQRMLLQAGVAADALITEDAAEGRAAFAEKRAPAFRGM